MRIYFFLGLLFAAFSAGVLKAEVKTEDSEPRPDAFHFDAVVFKGAKPGEARVDVYTIVPYESLYFVNSGKVFGAKFNITVSVFDTAGSKVTEKSFERLAKETDYFVTQGGTAKFDFSQTILSLPKGSYKLKATLSDDFSKAVYDKSRSITVIDFDAYDVSLSGILLLSSIEENKGKYKITPHVSDNVGNLKDGFFTFFEVYKTKPGADTIDFVYEIYDSANKYVASGPRYRKVITEPRTQVYLPVAGIPPAAATGTYTLKVAGIKPSASPDWRPADYIAMAQRSIRFVQTFGGTVMNDINLAIKQLRYVANQKDMDFIEEGKTIEEKTERFRRFWKNLDPTPETERNEAFDEYYARVAFADRNFKAYTQGWQTDKGMVYITYGLPFQVNKQTGTDGKLYETWTYQSNREFVFVDNTGFGDFRLVRPLVVSEKYRYKGNK